MTASQAEMKLEDQLQAMGLTAPRVTPAMIDAMIEGVEFHNLSDTHIICKLTMFGGRFHVTGESSTVSKENFVQSVGEEIAERKARDQVWPLAGAILANDLHNFRYPLTEDQLKLDVGVQRVILEAKEVTMRVDGLTAILGMPNLHELLPEDEYADLKVQLDLYQQLKVVLDRRLARIGL
ncbi:MAG: hypothetical protein DI616_16045 [Paracoccus denitrificans]|uniref:Uncharacterized protein n=1 Tax=Paracoccus denitrificans TaxID=266 RepID=A0A533I0L2_PARDE|nr:MAG: hypothetical protein DI616_16045 [Paracoccus denitrificans]